MKFLYGGLVSAAVLAMVIVSHGATSENTSLPSAAPIALDSQLDGTIETNSNSSTQSLYYRLDLNSGDAGARMDVVLTNPSRARLDLTLVDGTDATISHAHRLDSGELRLSAYVLGPGAHILKVSAALDPGQPAPSFTLAIKKTGQWQPGEEREPNDTPATETQGAIALGMKGEIADQDDADYFALNVDGPLQLWTIEANGPAANALSLIDAAGNQVRHASRLDKNAKLLIWRVLLPPGLAHFRISGPPGAWQVTAHPQGPAPIDVLGGAAPPREAGQTDEVEPDDSPERALVLPMNGSRSGLIDSPDDADYYHFTLQNEAKVHIALSGPTGIDLHADVHRGTSMWAHGNLDVDAETTAPAATGTAEATFDLPQGDYYLDVHGVQRSDTPYVVALSAVADPGPLTDFEPNDGARTLNGILPSLRLIGAAGRNDTDVYRLPDLDQLTKLTVTAASAPAYMSLAIGPITDQSSANGPERVDLGPSSALTASPDGKAFSIDLPAGKDRYLKISASDYGAYDLSLAFDDGPKPVTPSAKMSAKLTLDTPSAAAFFDASQIVHGTFSITNGGNATIKARLAVHPSDDRWQAEGLPPTVELGAGQTADLPVSLVAPPLLFGDDTITIVGTIEAPTGITSSDASIKVSVDAPPVSPERRWELPPSMLGGINVAWSALGGTASPGHEAVIDGFATSGTSRRVDASDDALKQVILKLAGPSAVRLSGLTINPTVGPDIGNQIRRIAVEASVDGQTYNRVFEGEVGARQREYAFPFAGPVDAHFLKILPLDTQGLDNPAATIGEVKAIAAPEVVASLAPQGLNIADPKLGGFLTSFHPTGEDAALMLSGEATAQAARISETDPRQVDWTVAFRDQRAARLTRLEWQNDPTATAAETIKSVRIETAMEIGGPYVTLGVWEVAPGASGAVAPYVLPQPTWARFLRFTVAVTPADPKQPTLYVRLPKRLAIFEALPGPEGGSIVGEWGDLTRDGPFEALYPRPLPDMPSAAVTAGNTQTSATVLPLDQPVSGIVSAGSREEWWSIDVPAKGKSLALSLASTSGLAINATVQDATGSAVPTTVRSDDGKTRVLDVKVHAGRYLVHIQEPPRSIAIVWDTSGSVGPYTQTVVQSVRSFVRFLSPGRDEVALFPFSDPEAKPLLKDWTGDPTTAFAALNGYDWHDGSSSAEGGILGAGRALDGRPGTRAIILITDYATSGTSDQRMQALDLLKKTGARVFNFAIPSGSDAKGAAFERGLMLTFAAASNGTATYAGTPGELEEAFERTTAALRAPKRYTIHAAVSVKPPEPGLLQVVVPDQDVTLRPSKDRAVLVIFDASGSMLQHLGKRTKIDVARDTLNELTQKMLPPGTPFAMRIFGDVKAGSCETNLRIPLAPLDPAATKHVVDKVVSINGARTAIAEALKLAPQDLATATGEKLIILITDGEETCGGNPAKEIKALHDSGIDARINIVGFDVDNAALKDTFSTWAASGGGGYFDASKPDQLAPALRKALSPSYMVLGADGTIVANGVAGGGPIDVPPGSYTVRILSDPPQDYPGVAIESGKTITIPLHPN